MLSSFHCLSHHNSSVVTIDGIYSTTDDAYLFDSLFFTKKTANSVGDYIKFVIMQNTYDSLQISLSSILPTFYMHSSFPYWEMGYVSPCEYELFLRHTVLAYFPLFG